MGGSLQRRSGSASRGRRAPLSLRSSWERQGWPLRILRAFLGGTFLYAGLQKFLDPNFLHAGTPDYVGTQVQAFAAGSPIRPVLLLLDHVAVLAGVGVALTEVATGVGTLFGIAPIAWAAVGLGINVALFLSATWHVHPYFLGSDSMYAVGWGAYLAGLVEIRHRVSKGVVAHGTRRERARAAEGMPRREFMRGAAVAAGAVILGVTSSVLAGPPTRTVPPAVPAPGRKPRPGGPTPDDNLVNDGCPAVVAPETNCADTVDNDGDGFINDGCPQVGTYAEGGFNIGTSPQAPLKTSTWPLWKSVA